MNKKITLFAALSVILAINSCTPNLEFPGKPIPDVGDPTSIVVSASALPQATRMGLEEDIITTEWNTNDELGLYVRFKDELDVSGIYKIQNAGDIGEDKTRADFHGNFKWKAAALPHTFYAYAPRITTPPTQNNDGETVYVDADPKAIPISLPWEQTQDAYGNDFISDNSFFLAIPREITAPKNFIDENLARKVGLEMKSAFAILEFRIASWEGEDTDDKDVRVKKLSITSDKRPLAVSHGTIDITKPLYDSDFAAIRADDADYTNTVTLDIANGGDVPRTVRQQVIIGNKSREEADIDVIYPARILVMPNKSIPLAVDEDEKWTVKVEYTINGQEQEPQTRILNSRPLLPGERHAIPFVLITADGAVIDPPEEDPGPKWDGSASVKPAINDVDQTITITTPAELKWFADAVNNQVIADGDVSNTATRVYDNYTLKLANNIDLGGFQWIPIGYHPKIVFRGSVDGGGHLVSGLNVSPGARWSGDVGESVNVGLFGRVEPGPNAGDNGTFKDLRVKGTIAPANIFSGKDHFIGGVLGQAMLAVSGCQFEGTITATITTSNDDLGRVGGITAFANNSIMDCKSSANITITTPYDNINTNVGGIIGHNSSESRIIQACEFTGSIRVVGSGSIGGIAGESSVQIRACRNTGNLVVEDGSEASIGGIVALHRRGTVTACYNTGNLDLTATIPNTLGSVGGISGVISTNSGAIRACYSRGRITNSAAYAKVAGNIIGKIHTTTSVGPYDYNRIAWNYFLYNPIAGDLMPEMEMTSVMRFTPNQWPQSSYPGWGSGDGSGENKYWNTWFPDSYGTEDWEYPQLYWEVIL